jgi:hypothetical protein
MQQQPAMPADEYLQLIIHVMQLHAREANRSADKQDEIAATIQRANADVASVVASYRSELLAAIDGATAATLRIVEGLAKVRNVISPQSDRN